MSLKRKLPEDIAEKFGLAKRTATDARDVPLQLTGNIKQTPSSGQSYGNLSNSVPKDQRDIDEQIADFNASVKETSRHLQDIYQTLENLVPPPGDRKEERSPTSNDERPPSANEMKPSASVSGQNVPFLNAETPPLVQQPLATGCMEPRPVEQQSPDPVLERLHIQPDILSHCDWVDPKIVQEIVDGTLQVTNLYKLQREENLRTPKATINDLSSFLSAWMVYMAIRTAFAPERAAGLAMWTARLIHFSSLNPGNFLPITQYALSYLHRYQAGSPDTWFDVCSELYSRYIGAAPPPPLRSEPSPNPSPPSTVPSFNHFRPSAPITSYRSQDICRGWNSPFGCKIKKKFGTECLRKHICLKCESPDHRAFERRCAERSSHNGTAERSLSYQISKSPLSARLSDDSLSDRTRNTPWSARLWDGPLNDRMSDYRN